MKAFRVWIGCLVLLSNAGCGQGGRLLVELALPEDTRLDPLRDCPAGGDCEELDPRLSRFSIRLSLQDRITTQDSRIGESREVVVGRVPVDEPFDLRLAGETAAGQTLGLGIVRGVVADTDETLISVHFRKPVAYVLRPREIQVFDAAADSRAPIALESIEVAGQVMLDTAPNGLFLATASAKDLLIFGTTNHKLALRVPLQGAPRCLSISPDGRYVFLCLPTGLAAVDLLADEPELLDRSVGANPRQVVFGKDPRTAWVLVDDEHSDPLCPVTTPRSLLSQIDYGPHRKGATAGGRRLPDFEPRARISGIGHVTDVALHPGKGTLLLARPCTAQKDPFRGEVAEILAVPADSPPLKTLLRVPDPRDINVTDEAIVVLTRDATENSPQGQVVFLPLTGSSASLSYLFELPPLSLKLGTTGDDSSGSFDWISEPQGAMTVFDAEVTPDGRRALVFHRATYTSSLSPLPNCTVATDITVEGFVLVDLSGAGGSLIHRITKATFDRCSAPCLTHEGRELKNQDQCARAFRGSLEQKGLFSRDGDALGRARILFGGS